MMAIIFLIGFVLFLIPIAVVIFTIMFLWHVFKKAGKEGWEALVPIYNVIVLLEITELPIWYIALLFVPLGCIYVYIMICLELSRRFKQSTGFSIGLIFLFPIFVGILAFNESIKYEVPKSFATIFCSECGNKVGNNDKFCANCGTKI